MKLDTFFEKFEHFADAPGAVAKLRELILQLAVQGKLVPQDPDDEPAEETFPSLVVAGFGSDASSIPEGWIRVPLGRIGEWRGGGTPSKSRPEFWKGDLPWVSPKDMKVLHIADSQDHISPEAVEGSSVRLIPPGSLLMVIRGMILARAFPVALTMKEVTINQDMKAILPSYPQTKDYLLVALCALGPEILDSIERSSHGTCKLKTEFLHNFSVLLPPLREQQRIVAKVDELMGLCDRLESQQRERETQASQLTRASLARFAEAPTPANLQYLFHPSYDISPADLRKSILTLAVQGKLVPQDTNDEPASALLAEIAKKKQAMIEAKIIRQGKVSRPHSALDAPTELPPGWEWVNLDSLCFKVTDGTHFTPQYATSGVRFVSAKDIAGGNLVFDRCKFITREEHDRLYRRCNPEFNDIVISKSGSIGTVALIEDRGEFSLFESLALLKFDQTNLFPPFLVSTLTHACSSLTSGHIRGVGVKHLHLDILRGLELALPPLAEQRRIVAKVDELMKLVDELESQLAASRAASVRLLSALVAELSAA